MEVSIRDEDRVEATWSDQAASGMAMMQLGASGGGQTTELALRMQRDRDILIQEVFDSDVRAVVKDGKTGLLLFAEVGMWDYVDHLIEYDADVNDFDENGVTALMHASQHGNVTAMKSLVQNGANVNAADECGKTALMRAAESGILKAISYLLRHGANVNATDHHCISALILAAASGKWHVVKSLADNGADISLEDHSGRCVLMYAAERSASDRSDWDIVRFLVSRGANVNAVDPRNRRTVLMFASAEGKLDIVKFLLNAGADAARVDSDGRSAIFFATNSGHEEVRRLLMRYERYRDGTASIEGNWHASPFDIELVKFEKTKKIGGEYLAKWFDADVVLKLFVAGANDSTFESEVTVWHQLRHPHVIKLYGACDNIHHFFVCEHARNGSLREYLADCDSLGTRPTPWKFLHEAALGLAYLHERKIVHRNLRGSSILIGNDGFAKLADFELSGTEMPPETRQRAGSELVRWQAPEQLRGEQATSASDIYSLGLCIVEAVGGSKPWGTLPVSRLRSTKLAWDPVPDDNSPRGPAPLRRYSTASSLVAKMCCLDKTQRITASSVVQLLSKFAEIEFASMQPNQPEPEPSTRIIEDMYTKLEKSWSTLRLMHSQDADELQTEVLSDIEEIYERLTQHAHPVTVLERFHALLDESAGFLQAMHRILHLSSPRVLCTSARAVLHRIDAIWAMIDASHTLDEARRQRQELLLSRKFDTFVSEETGTLLVLHDLRTEQDRVSFQQYLLSEIDPPSSYYSERESAIMRKVFDGLSNHGNSDALITTPVWFLPWYEVVVDFFECLGEGGFASVFRAKWLDSDVVVKEVQRVWSRRNGEWTMSTWSNLISSSIARSYHIDDQEPQRQLLSMFHHEVTIWFGLNHPHVVRLFGACHIGTLIFACEYATNGTLVEYLQKNPHEIWEKLYEAALGVQYLHAIGIVHGDLKGNNIVIGSDRKAKVTDFGLSSTEEDGIDGQVSAAFQWVAPECFGVRGMVSFASDVYSLGMCIVESLRVVEDARYRLPWGELDNITVKVLSKSGKFPSRPQYCTDMQWELVTKMCRFKSEERIKISTVVDELRKLAFPNEDGSAAVSTSGPSVSIGETIADMKATCNQNGESSISQIYELFWDRIKHVSSMQIDNRELEGLTNLTTTGESWTRRLITSTTMLLEFTELAVRGYTLHRKLDKFIEATFLDVSNHGEIHDWKSKCRSIMGATEAHP